jgi:hypothetical protein
MEEGLRQLLTTCRALSRLAMATDDATARSAYLSSCLGILIDVVEALAEGRAR